MPPRCRGICGRYPVRGHAHSYGRGDRRCTACDVWIEWDGSRCPCCSSALRTVTRKPARARRQKKEAAERRRAATTTTAADPPPPPPPEGATTTVVVDPQEGVTVSVTGPLN